MIAYLHRNPQGGDRAWAGDQPPPLAGTRLHHGPALRLPRRTSAACWYRDRRLPVLYKVPQFFVARTERLRLVQWDENLKRVDHNDFFTRAYGVLLTVYDKQFYCLHAQPKFNTHYQNFRCDYGADIVYLNRKWS